MLVSASNAATFRGVLDMVVQVGHASSVRHPQCQNLHLSPTPPQGAAHAEERKVQRVCLAVLCGAVELWLTPSKTADFATQLTATAIEACVQAPHAPGFQVADAQVGLISGRR